MNRQRFREALYINVIAAAILPAVVLSYHAYMDNKVKLAQVKAYKFSSMLAACMNGKPLFDYVSKTTFFCEKVVAVKL